MKEPHKVEDSQDTIIEAMKFHLRMTHPHDSIRLAKLITLLTEMRTLSELNRVQEEKIEMQWSGHIQFPPLLYEMCST